MLEWKLDYGVRYASVTTSDCPAPRDGVGYAQGISSMELLRPMLRAIYKPTPHRRTPLTPLSQHKSTRCVCLGYLDPKYSVQISKHTPTQSTCWWEVPEASDLPRTTPQPCRNMSAIWSMQTLSTLHLPTDRLLPRLSITEGPTQKSTDVRPLHAVCSGPNIVHAMVPTCATSIGSSAPNRRPGNLPTALSNLLKARS
jgi:hypothetical protein